jgi:hypothetical protein
MDELIILLIKGLAKLLGADQPPKARQVPAQSQSQRSTPQAVRRTGSQRQQPKQQPQRRAAPAKGRGPAPARPVPPPARTAVATDDLEVVSDIPSTAAGRGAAAVAAAPMSTASHKPASVNALAIHRWLTPSVLQKQFILTEVLQPPLALRGDR